MNISILTLKILIFLIPGIIANKVVHKLTIKKKQDTFTFIISSLILGILSYLLLQLFIDTWNLISFYLNINYPKKELQIWLKIFTDGSIPYLEILYGSIIGFLVGIFLAVAENRFWFYKVASYFKISQKSGDTTLFYSFLNSPDVIEVYVRDFSKDITYHGYLDSFNEHDNIGEIVLNEVSIYHSTDSVKLYDSPHIYLSRKLDDLTIEVVNKDVNNN